MSNYRNQDFGDAASDEEEDDFNPVTHASDDEGADNDDNDQRQDNNQADDDDHVQTTNRRQSAQSDDQDEDAAPVSRRANNDDDDEEDEDDEEEEEDEDEDDEDIVRYTKLYYISTANIIRRANLENAAARVPATNSSMLKPKLMMKMRRSPMRMMRLLAKRCTLTTCLSFPLVPSATTASIVNSTDSAIWPLAWMPRNKPRP